MEPKPYEPTKHQYDRNAPHLGDTVETVSRTYAHWRRDEADVPAKVLNRVLAPSTADASQMLTQRPSNQ